MAHVGRDFTLRLSVISFLLFHLNLVTDGLMLHWYQLLQSFLYPYFDFIPTWDCATPIERYLFATTPHLAFLLMQGAWWTFFRWFQASFFYLYLKFCTFSAPSPQAYQLDVRMWIPVSLFIGITLNGWTTTWPRARHKRPSSGINHHQFGIRVRLRYRLCHLNTNRSKVPAEIATRQSDTTKCEQDSRPVTEPEGAHTDDDLASEFDLATDRSKWNIPCVMNELDHEVLYGFSKQVAWSMLDNMIDPLRWFQKEMEFTTSSDFLSSYQLQVMQKAFIAATAILTELNVPRNANVPLRGAFLSGSAAEQRVPIVIDTGASFSLTPFKSDFVSKLERPDIDAMHGISDSVKVQGMGWVEWRIRDVFGQVALVRTRAYYVPSSHIRLFSPQSYFELYEKGHGTFDHKCVTLTTVDDIELTFPYAQGGKLPLMFLDHHCKFVDLSGPVAHTLGTTTWAKDNLSLLIEQNLNLTRPQKELNIWHYRLAHAGYGWIQSLMRVEKVAVGSPGTPPIIPTTNGSTSKCEAPKCPSCLLGKQHRHTPGSQTTKNKPEREMAIRRKAMKPGDLISGDQYVCKTPGRLPNTFGKERPSEQYHGGTIFVDAFSSYVHLVNQISLRIGETLVGKHKFDSFARQCGIKLKHFRVDNHPFNAKDFLEDLEDNEQTISYSGVGAHFQNGVAERAQQTVVQWARSMMLHQLLHWPEVFDTSLWPYALEHAVYIWNNLPRQGSRLSPLELFTGQKQPDNGVLLRARVWGCPAYVLDPKLQDGKKLPKWNKRSRVGVYLGCSPTHHSSVGRILNLRTGAISPQYHVVYDELFSTVIGGVTDAALDPEVWTSILNLDSIENQLAESDLNDPDVVRVATDLYDEFVRADDDDDATSTSSSTVPEGELSDDDSESDTEGTSAPEGAQPPLDGEYRTRSGRISRKPQYAATLFSPERCPSTRHQPHQRELYLAGGNPNARVRARKLQNEDVHKWIGIRLPFSYPPLETLDELYVTYSTFVKTEVTGTIWP